MVEMNEFDDCFGVVDELLEIQLSQYDVAPVERDCFLSIYSYRSSLDMINDEIGTVEVGCLL